MYLRSKNRSARSRAKDRPAILNVPRLQQPDDVSCGPTCLAQVYDFYGYRKDLSAIIADTPSQADGGTLAVYLGLSALREGFSARLYSYNLRVFDPTWFDLDVASLVDRLRQRRESVSGEKLVWAITGYQRFLELGGELRFSELSERTLADILRRGHPVVTGLNATYLWRTPRERDGEYDDIGGDPAGHFVVVSGYYPRSRRFIVRDPSPHVPFSPTGRYSVNADRLISAILLGDISYDAVLLELVPR